MTLGVMYLSRAPTTQTEGGSSTGGKTIRDALDLLASLRPQIIELMTSDSNGTTALQAPLRGLDIMGNQKKQAHVMWTGPGEKVDESPLWKVSCT